MDRDSASSSRIAVLLVLLFAVSTGSEALSASPFADGSQRSPSLRPEAHGAVIINQLPAASINAVQPYERRRLTILSTLCPPGYTGGDYYSDCRWGHGIGLEFRIGLPNSDGFTDSVSTDDYGVVSFNMFAVGVNDSIRILESLPTGIVHTFPDCYSAAGEQLQVNMPDYSENPSLAVADVVVGQEGDVFCNWFNAPEPPH